MRIAVWHNLPSGGGKRALYDHVAALKARGHYLEGWTTDWQAEEYLPLGDMIKEHRLPVKGKVLTVQRARSPMKRTAGTISILKEHSQRCVREIESAGFDLIFANSCSFTHMPFIGLYASIPSVLYLGEPYRRFYESSKYGNPWELPDFGGGLRKISKLIRDARRIYAQRLQVREEILAARSYSRILVNSLYSRESVLRAYGIDSSVCYLGVDERKFSSDLEIQKQPHVLGVGRISAAKDVEKAVRVVSIIPKAIRPELRWISNGREPDYLSDVIRLAKELGVVFSQLVDITDHMVVDEMRKAAVVLYTSRLEPFGLGPLEANMCGTAVVAVAEGGVRESIQHGFNGFLVSGDRLAELAENVSKFTTDLEYSRQMGERAREHTMRLWNREHMADNIEHQLLAVFEEVHRQVSS